MAWPLQPIPDPIPRLDGKSGNRCGHNPETPLLYTALAYFQQAAERIPKILQKTIRRAERYFQEPDQIFPGLCHLHDRQQRAERREAAMRVLGCYLQHTDLVTLRCANISASGEVLGGLGHDLVAQAAGLTISRVQRAVADMKRAGLITVHPLAAKLDDCTYAGYNAIVTISEMVFDAVGVLPWLKHERRKAADRRRKKARSAGKAGVKARLANRLQPAATPVGEKRNSGLKPAAAIFDGLRSALGRGPPRDKGG